MSRTGAIMTAVAFAALALPAFATNDVSLTGSAAPDTLYKAAPGGKTREQVRVELEAAIKDGSFALTTRNRSAVPDYDPRWTHVAAARAQQADNVARSLKSGGEIIIDAPAAGGRSRSDVQQELERARQDGSLRRMNTNRGY